MIDNTNIKSILQDIKKDLETHIVSKNHKDLYYAEHKYHSYLISGGTNTFEAIQRSVTREYAQGMTW